MKKVMVILLASISATAFAGDTTQCYRGVLKNGSVMEAKMITQDFRDVPEDSIAVSYLKVSLLEKGKTYSELAIGDEDSGSMLESGYEVTFGVEDDGGHAILKQSRYDSSTTLVAGKKDYAMRLTLSTCDRYSEDFDDKKCTRKLSTTPVALKKVSCPESE